MVTLSDGRQISPDLNKITIREYRAIFAPEGNIDYQDTLVARVYGLSVDELLDLGQRDYKLMIQEFIDQAGNPVKNNPN